MIIDNIFISKYQFNQEIAGNFFLVNTVEKLNLNPDIKIKDVVYKTELTDFYSYSLNEFNTFTSYNQSAFNNKKLIPLEYKNASIVDVIKDQALKSGFQVDFRLSASSLFHVKQSKINIPNYINFKQLLINKYKIDYYFSNEGIPTFRDSYINTIEEKDYNLQALSQTLKGIFIFTEKTIGIYDQIFFSGSYRLIKYLSSRSENLYHVEF